MSTLDISALVVSGFDGVPKRGAEDTGVFVVCPNKTFEVLIVCGWPNEKAGVGEFERSALVVSLLDESPKRLPVLSDVLLDCPKVKVGAEDFVLSTVFVFPKEKVGA